MNTRRKPLAAAPPGLDDLLAQAMQALGRGAAQEALGCAQRAVQGAPTDASAAFVLGRAHKALGDLHAAVAAYRRALDLRPAFAEAHVSLGIALKAQGDLDEAIACYQRAIAIAPGMAVAHNNLGAALAQQALQRATPGTAATESPHEAGIAAQERAAQLAPQDPAVQRNLGAALLNAGRPADAMHAFNAVLGLDPTDAASCLHLVKCLVALGDHGLARAACEKWLAHNGDDAEVLHALANALTMVGEVDTGLQMARRSLDLAYSPVTAMQLGNSLLQARRLEEGLAVCREAVDRSGRDVRLYPVLLMALSYLHEDPAPVVAAHAELAPLLQPFAVETAEPAEPRSHAAGEPLRVGFVSGDFVRHSVAFFMEPLLQHLDPQRFAITCFHNNARSDGVTERLKSYGAHWVDSAHLADDTLARRVRDERIDLLVDLAGMTANSRMLMFARKPALVQLGYLGYPTVSGVPAMDWRITDPDIDPGDVPELASDKPLLLPRTMFCYRPPADAPDVAPPPCLSGRPPTFGSFNNMAKLSDRTLGLWARVLQAVPGSRLLLKSATAGQASTQRSVEAFMAAQGIAAGRLLFSGRLANDAEHLALYHQVDVALDSFPYNGATTTCEALWMGVPVVSLRGRTHTARMGASILRAAGHSDWVAADEPGFVTAAAALVSSPQALADLRAGQRQALRSSELLDGPGMARDFGALLEQAWARRTDQAGTAA